MKLLDAYYKVRKTKEELETKSHDIVLPALSDDAPIADIRESEMENGRYCGLLAGKLQSYTEFLQVIEDLFE